MKRSKAVEEIRKILAMNGKDNGYGELEEALLHTMESIGMLPPVSEETTKQHNQSTIDAMFDSITYDFKWDLEE
jgi:hypothetical protein